MLLSVVGSRSDSLTELEEVLRTVEFRESEPFDVREDAREDARLADFELVDEFSDSEHSDPLTRTFFVRPRSFYTLIING